MRIHLQLAAVGIVMMSAPAAAQESIELPMLDTYRLGHRSMIAADSDRNWDGRVGGGLDVGPRFADRMRGPYGTASVSADVGFYDHDFDYMDAASDLAARWSFGPLRDDGPGEVDVAGQHRLAMMLGPFVEHDGFYLDVSARQAFHHSSSGAWGERPIDVANEPFYQYLWGMSVWLNHGGPDRDDLKSLEIHYDVRATWYTEQEPINDTRQQFRSRQIHRVGLGIGGREHSDSATRLYLTFLSPSYVHASSGFSPTPFHRFDYDVLSLRFFGGEVDDFGGMALFTVGGSAAWEDREGAEAVHTPNLRLAVRFDVPVLLDFGFAGGHRPEFDPAAMHTLGVTSFETHMKIDPEPHHYGALIRGRIDRVVALERDQLDDRWQGTMTGELYTRIFGMKLGALGRGGYGHPTGSMGWNPFGAEPRWSAYVGGFVRGEACFSKRCDTAD